MIETGKGAGRRFRGADRYFDASLDPQSLEAAKPYPSHSEENWLQPVLLHGLNSDQILRSPPSLALKPKTPPRRRASPGSGDVAMTIVPESSLMHWCPHRETDC
jgi:hypothetical protein